MDFERTCPIVDTVIEVTVANKRAMLHDLAHRAAPLLKVDDALMACAPPCALGEGENRGMENGRPVVGAARVSQRS
jgi:hypothetical protein